MREQDLRRAPLPSDLPVYEEHDERAREISSPARCCEMAEAEDMVRLYQLLHRIEYQPVAVIVRHTRFGRDARVYFQRVFPHASARLYEPAPGRAQFHRPGQQRGRYAAASRDESSNN